MALVQKLNVVLEVEDELVNHYLDKGYNVISKSGEVIKEAIPNDLNQLQIMIIKQREKIAELEAKLAEYTNAENEALPVEEEVSNEQEAPAPKKRGRKPSAAKEN